MADTYQNYADLADSEVEGTDYQIRTQKKDSPIIALAIHGGGIETGTSELAIAAAGDQNSYYLFEGLKSSGNGVLHITSTHFDEPQALELVPTATYSYSFHGFSDSENKHTLVGGGDLELRQKVYDALVANGFSAEILETGAELGGSDPDNIANKTKSGKGVQLEISTLQRKSFFGTNTREGRPQTQNEEFYRYVEAVKSTFPSA